MITEQISKNLGLRPARVSAVIELLDSGATIPFIARYRKEATGNMDEVQLAEIRDMRQKLQEFIARKEYILQTLSADGVLSSALRQQIEACSDNSCLEDLYLPFKKSKNTKAEKARQKGLEPLARMIMAQNRPDTEAMARSFVGKKGVKSIDDALEGAGHIIAEWINEKAGLRARLRKLFKYSSTVEAVLKKGAADEQRKYKNYYEHREPAHRIASHRLLAILRGEKEGVLRVTIRPEKEEALQLIEDYIIKPHSATRDFLQKVIRDAWGRLLLPSLESEWRNTLKTKADTKAVDVFASNLEQLLMAPPLPGKNILAIDPGFRTGCKVVCLDRQGMLLHNETIYPHPPHREEAMAKKKLSALVDRYAIDAIAIGNGTAGRETELLVSKIRFRRPVVAVMVNESGASVYSASAVAREEFPQYDITVRGAVSIGRRLADPLAELVKIEPKAIGVGQYQHDVDQKMLQSKLDDVVINCVNKVGVDGNTASKELLQYISGLSATLAKNIVQYRQEHGPFRSREALKKVPRLGPKAYEQAAGFIRFRQSANPMDNTGVHPESYPLAAVIARSVQSRVEQVIGNSALLDRVDVEALVARGYGRYTLLDIIAELKKPGRDPRKKMQSVKFSESIKSIHDLKEGMKLRGIVTNITAFGAFVDLGIHQDALIHISQLADGFVSDPHTIVRLRQVVDVEVIKLDIEHKRINLKKL